MEKGFYDTLSDYCHGDMLPMHMPGHKRNKKFSMENPYGIDVTEVTGMDDLHCPEGVIRKMMDKATAMYGSDQSYLLVNGSTCGILSAITACCRCGDRILVARNCHKAVYNAIRLLELRPLYVLPDGDGGDMEHLGIPGSVRTEEIERILGEYRDVSCVVLTSPTYEGIVSPIREIAEVVHRSQIPLIVDEAHGAHFNWHKSFPDTALTEGADIVIESLHKTLPSFTQTGILHARYGLADRERLEWSLQTYQSSSPSYLLMAGIDRCFAYIENEGGEDFEKYVENLRAFSEKMNCLEHLYLFGSDHKEASKIVIATDRTEITGKELADILREQFRIETEMNCGDYCIAMTSVADEKSSFDRLGDALKKIDAGLGLSVCGQNPGFQYVWNIPETGLYSYEAAAREREKVPVKSAEGRMAAEDIYLYPPGVPFVVQGEILSREILAHILDGEKAGYRLHGVRDGFVNVIRP